MDFSKDINEQDITYEKRKSVEMKIDPSHENYSNRRRKIKFFLEPYKVVNKACQSLTCYKEMHVIHTMIILVKSSLTHSYNRDLIRGTWGSFTVVKQIYIDTVFVVGRGELNSANMRSIFEENSMYGDILLYDGPDDYKNIPFKTLAGMQWASDNFPNNYLYSSADDDMLIDVISLVKSIEKAFVTVVNKNWPEFPLICGFVKGLGEQPVRDEDSIDGKWAIEKHAFKWHVFPPYCHGGLYTTTVSVAGQLYDLSRDVELLRLDDVWITGILRRKLEMPDDMVLNYPKNNRFHFTNFSKNVTGNSILYIERWSKMYDELKAFRQETCECHKGDVAIDLCS